MVEVKEPIKDIYNLEGNFKIHGEMEKSESIFLDNSVWAGTVLTAGKSLGIVIYTGPETRVQMNSCSTKIKAGLVERDVNI